jgi:hypothetical protein
MTRMNAIYKKIYRMKNHSAQILKKKKTFIESMAFFTFVFFGSWKKKRKEVRIKVITLENMLTRIILHIMK